MPFIASKQFIYNVLVSEFLLGENHELRILCYQEEGMEVDQEATPVKSETETGSEVTASEEVKADSTEQVHFIA